MGAQVTRGRVTQTGHDGREGANVSTLSTLVETEVEEEEREGKSVPITLGSSEGSDPSHPAPLWRLLVLSLAECLP